MRLFERFDRFLIEELFQPVQDLITRLRQRSDHAPAIVCVIASTVCFGIRTGIWHASIFSLISVALCALMTLVTSFLLFAYGYLHRDRNAPGLWGGQWGLRAITMALAILQIASNAIHKTGAEATLALADPLLWLCGIYFGSCSLKRPPPIERKLPIFAVAGAQ